MYYEELDLDIVDCAAEGEDIGEAVVYEIPTESNIVPTGVYLGLDISKDSTGVCLYENGVRGTANIKLFADEKSPHFETLLRRNLKDQLAAMLVDNKAFDAIVIEDVFEGVNPETSRTLYALNTAIDELILDGVFTVKEFVRVNNQKWKSWLYWLDAEGKWKGFNDKVKIAEILKSIGITEVGAGYQDRLDATGMLIGYFLQKGKDPEKVVQPKIEKVHFSDIEFAYEEDVEFIKSYIYAERENCNLCVLDSVKLSKNWLIDTLSENKGVVFVTSSPVRLGFFGDKLGLGTLDNGGYFAFWLCEKAYLKLKRKGLVE